MNKLSKLLACFALILASRAAVADAGDIPVDQFLGQVVDAIKSMGGVPWAAKFGLGILVIVSSMKVSFLRPLWDKFGAAKVWIVLSLSLVGGVLMLALDGKLSPAGVMAYLIAGGGAVIMHEMLDTLKAVPGLGAIWIALIDVAAKLLGGDQPIVKD